MVVDFEKLLCKSCEILHATTDVLDGGVDLGVIGFCDLRPEVSHQFLQVFQHDCLSPLTFVRALLLSQGRFPKRIAGGQTL